MWRFVLPFFFIFLLCTSFKVVEDCCHTAADIVYVFDSSESVGSVNFLKMKEFFTAMVDTFPIGFTCFRIGSVTFSSSVYDAFQLDEYFTKSGLRNRISNIPFVGGDRNTAAAIRYARKTSFSSKYSRTNVTKIAIVITAGQSSNINDTLSEAELLRNKSVVIITLGVGSRVNMTEIVGMAYDRSYAINVSSFDTLDSVRERLYNPTLKDTYCGHPGLPLNGNLHVNNFCSGKTVTYDCKNEYKLIGDSQRTCLINNTWSGRLPTCIFFNTCKSNPCQNGATCINGEDTYTCDCVSGYSGVHCERDIQPPIVQDCPSDIQKLSPSRHVDVYWKAPHFYDPFNNSLEVTTNYPDHGSTFLWGDYFPFYSALKPSNGFRTECTFKISVEPYPCLNLTIPKNGALACNGWKREVIQFCVIFCQIGTQLSSCNDFSTRYVCGGNGQWLPTEDLPSCELSSVIPTPVNRPYYFHLCEYSKIRMKKGYLWLLQHSTFGFLCSNYRDLCKMENVDIQC